MLINIATGARSLARPGAASLLSGLCSAAEDDQRPQSHDDEEDDDEDDGQAGVGR